MTTVNTATASSGGSTTSTTNKSNIIGKDQFMQMLIAQLKNQDPLNPMDGTQFAAQLAQFSTVEQLYNMSTSLGSMTSSISAMNNMQITSLIGSDVSAQGNTTTVSSAVSKVVYSLPSAIQKATIKIYDSKGVVVKTLDVGSQNAGVNTLQWDSSNLASGNYTFDVTATDKNGAAVQATTMVTGKVTGINYKDGTPYVTVNGQDIAFSSVTSVTKPTTTVAGN